MSPLLQSIAGILALYVGYKIVVPKTLPSPVEYINALSNEEKKKLAYPLDIFPNGEFIKSPYGYIRAYRFGPLDGKKVLFLHGLTIPCPVFRDLAYACVANGFQVLLFDLFGRGYSEAPIDLPFDDRLHVSQILTVLAHYNWKEFDIIGYSLGGAIAPLFASCFPAQVQKLILIAPAGLLSWSELPFLARLMMSSLIPLSLVYKFGSLVLSDPDKDASRGLNFLDHIISAQTKFNPAAGWAYLSTLRHTSMFDQEDLFRSLGPREVFVICGGADSIVPVTIIDRMKRLGVNLKNLLVDDACHDLVMSKSPEVCKGVLEYLQT